ncbi:NXPE family member 4-like [Hyla sarda]|uniref:NXPE family member 4-like n=1 Tax=Hyla sarda TaxID=327740 RepID=UPI0024C45ECC|nr:NXPE family member 4-like [Hyla sarda]
MYRRRFLFLIAAVFLFGLTWYWKISQNPLQQILHICLRPPEEVEDLIRIKEVVTVPPKTELQEKIDAMYDKIEKNLIPNVTFKNFNTTSSGKHSKVSLVDSQKKYCIGEDFVVRIDMFDHLGNRKTYGGDFIRPRLFSQELGAAASGIVKDFNNGSYHVYFPLYWAGNVKVHILLFHPSEGVAALWRARHSSLGVIGFEGKFEKSGKDAVSKCGFEIDREEGKEICEYKDDLYEEAYYCYKVQDFPCESLRDMRGYELGVSYLTKEEKEMFQRNNIAVEIPPTFDAVSVTTCGETKEAPKPQCKSGMNSPLPSGHFYDNIWNPVYCNMTLYKTDDDFTRCLQGKKLFLIGDSTLRQFIMHFTGGIKIAKYFRYHGSGWSEWHKALEAINLEKDMYISYKRHGFPLEHPPFYYFKEDMYTSRQIDQLAGGKDTIIMITMGQHFRHFPIKVFIKRAFNIRRAVERLFIRSPDTKVVIKSENTRETFSPVEMQGDLHGYHQYLVLREVFQGINVGFVDTWDMTVAAGSVVVHPSGHTFQSILSMAFSFACQ